MKGVQCYELFGGIALKNHTFSFSIAVTCVPAEREMAFGGTNQTFDPYKMGIIYGCLS